MASLEQGVDAALFVGMHAMAGTRDGVLSRTLSRGSSWWRLRFNGVEVGETGINAALCGHLGLPGAARDRRRGRVPRGTELLGDGLTTVAVKTGLGRFSARQLPPAEGARADRGRCERSLADLKAVAPYDPGSPCEILVDFDTSDHVESYRYRPGVEIVTPRQIASRADDWWTAWRQFYF